MRLVRLLVILMMIAAVAVIAGTIVYLRFRPAQIVGRGPQAAAGQQEGAVNAAQKASGALVRVTRANLGASASPSPAPSSSPASFATGVVVDARGYVLTAEAAVAGATRVLVAVPGITTQEARILGTDPVTALTLLKVESSNLKALPLVSTPALEVGTGVVTLTAPDGGGLAEGAVAAVAVSASEPDPSHPGARHYLNNLLSLDVSPRDGQLGAPLLDGAGRLVGMIVATGPMDLAVDMSDALSGVQQLMESGRVSYPSLGFEYRQLTSAEASDRGITGGVLVLAVTRGSDADTGGVHVDDIVTAVNSTDLDAVHPLLRVLRGLSVDQTATITVRDGGQVRQVPVKVVLATL